MSFQVYRKQNLVHVDFSNTVFAVLRLSQYNPTTKIKNKLHNRILNLIFKLLNCIKLFFFLYLYTEGTYKCWACKIYDGKICKNNLLLFKVFFFFAGIEYGEHIQ